MKTSSYKTPSLEQIFVTVDGFNSNALLTRFAGSRLWSVHGSLGGGQSYEIEMYDGDRTAFSRATALRLAEQFIRTGREFL